ncbi:hemolin-like [Anticarsia gemmatalis]|uniref:hemolin-like n=1 Tax=Anticarsia gemmatalis TaxID=129554 RepID=UPI003F761523
MNAIQSSIVFAACIILCASQPTKPSSLPVLKDQPAEVLFKADNYSTVLLECVTESEEKDVKYSWFKNGSPFDWKALGHIAEREGEGSIMFFNPQPSDEGVYHCQAKTNYGTASTRPIALKKAYIDKPAAVATKEHGPVVGRPYKLDCVIPNSYPKPTITWKKQLKTDAKVAEEILDRRITLSPEGTLYFSNVTKEDVSPLHDYVCVAKHPAVIGELVLAKHNIKALIDDKEENNGNLVPQYLSKDMVAKVGDTTMIYCIFGGTPLGFPNWYKGDKLIEGKHSDRVTDHNRTSGKRLLIKYTYIEDEDTYTCKVDNKVGGPVSHSMKLTVVSAPRFLKNLDKQLDVKDSNDIQVPCKVTGKPEPKVTWTYNGKPIEKLSYKDGVLTVPKVNKASTGYYGCKAENEHGIVYAETLVNVV